MIELVLVLANIAYQAILISQDFKTYKIEKPLHKTIVGVYMFVVFSILTLVVTVYYKSIHVFDSVLGLNLWQTLLVINLFAIPVKSWIKNDIKKDNSNFTATLLNTTAFILSYLILTIVAVIALFFK